MPTRACTRRISALGYYLGRPAAFWLPAFGADVDDPQITPRVLRRAIGDYTQERKHSCHSVA